MLQENCISFQQFYPSGDVGWQTDSRIKLLMGHGVGSYIGLNEIRRPNPIMTFITINYLFNFIFGFIRYTFWDFPLRFVFVLINSTLCFCFW